jgi:hypothetical protein
VGGWPIAAVITIMMRGTHPNEKYTRGYMASQRKILRRSKDCRASKK